MFPISSRQPATLRILRTIRFSHSISSTRRSKPSRNTSALIAATLCLSIGVWVGVSKGTSFRARWTGEVKSVRPFTIQDVNAWLQKEQSTHEGPVGSGIREWHIIRRPSNVPCEDNLITAQHSVTHGESLPWMFWGIFDGHMGPATSAVLRESLVPYVVRTLSELFQSGQSKSNEPPPEAIDIAITSAFKQLDDHILSDGVKALKQAKTHTEALSLFAPGTSGSCAILLSFDPNTSLLRAACTGDSRAVLGIRSSSGKYIATAISVDQTGFNESEVARVKSEHPGEEDIIDPKTGRLMRLAPSRAFGDGLWKWPKSVIEECHESFWGHPPFKAYLTPPYLTAEPVITTTKVRGEGEFVVLASDGFWDHVSNGQAVGLVQMWMKAKKEGTIGKDRKKEGSRSEFARRIPRERKSRNEDFVVVDENCAAHLLRNALGGGDEELLCGIVGAQPPISREARDDITIQVIFFDNQK